MNNLSDSKAAVESRARRLARKLDMRVEKSRVRNLHSNNKGLYQLIDWRNNVVLCCDYEVKLADLVKFLEYTLEKRTANRVQ